ncbi:ABC transporter permease [Dyadobacter luteus]|uniref:ABC transporter permease n=1 Tax=Dyadobacter luteus TaxID=2259619 RepID=A0A3D8YHK4_9BACT|nr:ABC transporter permease [Dyadobacter luteus]REA64306.1 ABC transporter permease [Dyadobacter luteus]
MFKNYMKVALRSLLKNKVFSSINIVGLSLGLTAVMLILLFVQDEVSFDRFHQKGDRLYRLTATYTSPEGNQRNMGITGTPHGPSFAAEIPGIETFCRLKGWDMLVKKGTDAINEEVLYVDSSFFSCFSFPLIEGNPDKALTGAYSAVISEDMASRHFGTSDVLGKTIEVDLDGKFELFTITGVAQTPPTNSSVRFDVLIPFNRSLPTDAADREKSEREWLSYHLNTLLLLRGNADPAQVQAQFQEVFRKHAGAEFDRKQKERNSSDRLSFGIQPYTSIHLDPAYSMGNGVNDGSNATYSYILLGIAGLILFIACVNFINLTLARSLRRSKEIGVRKVTGSSRRELIFQFLTESFFLSLLAFLPALVLVNLLLPEFSSITGKALDVSYLLTLSNITLFAGLLLVVSLLAGAYPAFVLSGFRPVETLYGKFRLAGRNLVGKSLIVLQFSIAVFLLVGTFVFQSQFNFIADTDPGYTTDRVLRLEVPQERPGLANQLRNTIAGISGVEQVSLRSSGWRASSDFFIDNERPKEGVYFEQIDAKHLPLLKVPVVKGRNFMEGNSSDLKSGILVNESFVKEYIKAGNDAVGQTIEKEKEQVRVPFTIIGVVKDYQLGSFKEKIRPMMWYMGTAEDMGWMYVKLKPGASSTIAQIGREFHKSVPYFPFNYEFLEDERLSAYGDDKRWKQVVTYAAVMSVLISALGLFGLATLSMEQRTKEIGIRKVLGASILQISGVMSMDYLKLIIIAFAVAMPLGYYVSQQWLEGFVYRVNLGSWIFLASGGLVLLIALLTVASQAVRAAWADPVESLKNE